MISVVFSCRETSLARSPHAAAFFILHEFEQVDQSIKLVGFISRHTIRVIVAERTLAESAVGWVHRM
jgi:hypothetical protein